MTLVDGGDVGELVGDETIVGGLVEGEVGEPVGGELGFIQSGSHGSCSCTLSENK